MDNFIGTLRSDRLREINEYLQKGYFFYRGEEKKYVCIREIIIEEFNKKAKFQVRVDKSEVRFYVTSNEGTIYLSIFDIYQALETMKQKCGGEFVIYILEELLQSKNKINFSYQNIQYKIRFLNFKEIEDGKKIKLEEEIELENMDSKVTCLELFLLIMFIQEKSNYLFSLGENPKHDYCNGILRLYRVLLTLNKKNEFLEKLNWFYDNSTNNFVFRWRGSVAKKSREAKKYYLTEKEVKRILGKES